MQAARAGAPRPPRGRDAAGEGGGPAGGTRVLTAGHTAAWRRPAQHCRTNTLQVKSQQETARTRRADGRPPTYLWGRRCLSGGHGNSLAPPAGRRWDPPLRRRWKWASGSPETRPRRLRTQDASRCRQDSLDEHGDKENTVTKRIVRDSHEQALLPPFAGRHPKQGKLRQT